MGKVDWSNKAERSEYDRKRYLRTREKKLRQAKELRRRNREFINEYKLQRGCSVCGYNTTVRALDFHHLDPSTKRIEIGDALRLGYGIKTVLKEIEKCVLVCKNCHVEIHEGLIAL